MDVNSGKYPEYNGPDEHGMGWVGDFFDGLGLSGAKSRNIPGVKYPTKNTALYNDNPNDKGSVPSIMDSQMIARNKYKEDMPGKIKSDSDTLYNAYASGARRDLASKIKDTRGNFNSRGLLNSGMRAGAELGQKSQAASDMATKRRDINSSLLDKYTNNYDQMTQNVLNTGYTYAGLTPNLGGSVLDYQRGQLNNNINSNNNNANLAQGIGNLAGSIYGSSKKSPVTNKNSSDYGLPEDN